MITKKSKKGVSLLVEYVLLVTFSIILGIITYKLLMTFIIKPQIECDDGTSLLIKEYTYDCDSNLLMLNISNNGRFDIGGYFIYGTNSTTKQKGDIDLSKSQMDTSSNISNFGIKFGGFYDTDKNSLGPNEWEEEYYNFTKLNKQIVLVEIIPIRWQTQNKKMIMVSCEDAAIRKEIQCD